MDAPAVIEERVRQLSSECGAEFQIIRFWQNEYRPGWYCRFYGCIHRSELLLIELAGSLAIELDEKHKDDVDLFVFVNGTRVGQLQAPYRYLHRNGQGSLNWEDLDPGFENQLTLADITMTDRVIDP
jgi:hypothetical protein